MTSIAFEYMFVEQVIGRGELMNLHLLAKFLNPDWCRVIVREFHNHVLQYSAFRLSTHLSSLSPFLFYDYSRQSGAHFIRVTHTSGCLQCLYIGRRKRCFTDDSTWLWQSRYSIHLFQHCQRNSRFRNSWCTLCLKLWRLLRGDGNFCVCWLPHRRQSHDDDQGGN